MAQVRKGGGGPLVRAAAAGKVVATIYRIQSAFSDPKIVCGLAPRMPLAGPFGSKKIVILYIANSSINICLQKVIIEL